ncbi:MAG: hypothetical protein P8Y24_08430 [Gammaproteobacteria bacterium]
MNTVRMRTLLNQHPMTRRIAWVLFAIIFYVCGERFTVWLVEPENFQGGLEWLGVILFPVLLVLFFMSGRYLGCASGHCQSGQCSSSSNDSYYQRPPGL